MLFKFASNFSDKENKILIKIFTKDNALHSSFFNTKELQQASIVKSANGIGIANLKRRLELLHPENISLLPHIENEFYETNLILDLRMKLKCIIIDDEPVARKVLHEFVEEIDYLELTGKQRIL
jgi:LytS/YehU family sensor histidine kinase